MRSDIKANLEKLDIFICEEMGREGRYCVMKNTKNGTKFGHVDEDGNITTPIIYEHTQPFFEKRAKVMVDGKIGYVNLNGKLVIPAIYDIATCFLSGHASVYNGDRAGHINKFGKIVTPFIYDDTGYFYNSRAKVWLKDKIGYVDLNGKLVIPTIYDHGEDFIEKPVVAVKIKKHLFHIDEYGYPSSLVELKNLFEDIFNERIF